MSFLKSLFVHTIFLLFDFWYFGHFICMIFFPFFLLALHFALHLALQNVNKDYVIFSYFCNFVAKSDQKPKAKNEINITKSIKPGKSMFLSVVQSKNNLIERWSITQIYALLKLLV